MSKNTATIRSENLAVVFTDIVGFTETTAGQSREANASLLDRHDQLLIPIAEKFGGRRVKSIGDALLLVFRSSTDALLCCMAMQDALYQHNREFRAEPEIHIRTAVNVGEVRLSGGDVFGEAVNIAARLEGVTPRDAIYLTEAVHITMNRAEVPVEAVGLHRFKGVEDEIQVYQVPRFSSSKLVVEKRPGGDDGKNSPSEGFSYPFGGAHLIEYQRHQDSDKQALWRSPWAWATIAALLVLTLALGYLFWPAHQAAPVSPAATTATVRPPPRPLLPPPSPGTLRDQIAERIKARAGQASSNMAQFKIQALMAKVWPWLLDERWYISPMRLKEAPLPLGTPTVDDQAGALPLRWQNLPQAEQVLFASLQPSWDTLEPAYQHHLISAGKTWRGATPAQRHAVIEELRQWQAISGVERTLAARRMDYLRSLDADKRWQLISEHKLALSLAGRSDDRPGKGTDPQAQQLSPGIEVKPPPPKNIWDRPPGINMTTPGPDNRPPPRPQDRSFRPPPPPPDWDRRPPPPDHSGRPPPPWQRNGHKPPPPPR